MNSPTEIEPEAIVEEIFELKVRPGKKNDRAQGRIKLRFYYSCIGETRPNTGLDHHFLYEEFIPHFQTGDLVAYSEYGLLAAAQKLVTNNKFSRLGIVLRLANKWTQKEELYVLEVTRNIDNFLDAYRETATNGVSLFRFFERIHHIHAHSVWWIPMKKLLSESAKAKMVEHIWQTHAHLTQDNIGQMTTISYPTVTAFLDDRFGIGTKFHCDVTETSTPGIVAACLVQAGITIENRGTDMTCSELSKLAAFQDPILLRCGLGAVPSSSVPSRESSSLAASSGSPGIYGPPLMMVPPGASMMGPPVMPPGGPMMVPPGAMMGAPGGMMLPPHMIPPGGMMPPEMPGMMMLPPHMLSGAMGPMMTAGGPAPRPAGPFGPAT